MIPSIFQHTTTMTRLAIDRPRRVRRVTTLRT
jgi:hypothetical protein